MRKTLATAVLAGALFTAGAAPAMAFADHPDANASSTDVEEVACFDSHVAATTEGLPIFTDIRDARDYEPLDFHLRVDEGEHAYLDEQDGGSFEHRQSIAFLNGVRAPAPTFGPGDLLYVMGGAFRDAAGDIFYRVGASDVNPWIKDAEGIVVYTETPDEQPLLNEPGESCDEPQPASESAGPSLSATVSPSAEPVVEEQPAPTPDEPAPETGGTSIIPLTAGGIIVAGLAGLCIWDRAKRKKSKAEENSDA